MRPSPDENNLVPHLSPLNVWAFALGTSIGWGSLVITSNNYLASAGPAGSVLGLLLGGAIMLFIAKTVFCRNAFPG